jgi:glyoxylase-like metal-dependent hydrolase (beta-lactamase superfamily II)
MAVNIHSLTIPFKVPITPGKPLDRFVNLFIVEGEDLTLIDAGVKGSERAIFQKVRAIGRRPQEISRLILTHSHPDHIGAAPEVIAATGCAVLAHAAEKEWIERPAVQKAERPVPGFDTFVSGPVRLDGVLKDGEILDIGGSTLSVVHTPGHSKGSITLWSPALRTAITGDAVPAPGDFPIYDDAFAMIRSFRTLRMLGMETMLSAWTGPLEGHAITKRLDEAALLVQTIHRSVVRHSKSNEVTPALMAAVLQDIGQSPDRANPLVARAILSHLRYKNNLTQ